MKRSVFSSPSFFLNFRGITITFELSVWYAFAVVIIVSALEIHLYFRQIRYNQRATSRGVSVVTHLGEDFKVGENVAILWEKQDKSAHGGTDGVVLGVVGDEISGKYLIIDRSTYQDSFKSMLPFLNILDLKVIPLQEVTLFAKMDVRKRPPGILESSNLIMEVDYKSNIDFFATIEEVEKRSDCEHKRTGNSLSETYQFNIWKVEPLQKATIQISNKGTIQIFCRHTDLDGVIGWFKESAKLLSEQNCLVLVPTKVTYQIHSTFKDPAKPADDLIERLGKINRSQPIILPIGWIQKFFTELDKNPLRELFPTESNINEIAFEKTKNRKNQTSPSAIKSSYNIPEQLIDSQYLTCGVNINKYLGAGAPIISIKGLIKNPEVESELIQRWMGSRRELWNWFTFGDFEGKMNMRDLTFDKKSSTYFIDFRKYYGTDFFLTKNKSDSK